MAVTEVRRQESRVAVLVDCENVPPEILEHAVRIAAQFGRVVIRRGYGSHAVLGHRWQDALVRLAFTPCLQFQYASGKNTADIALALDALEVLFDGRADHFCLVTSDSDFAYLCRKLRERGATVSIVGETKTPEALRQASDQFSEWTRQEITPPAIPEGIAKPVPVVAAAAEPREPKTTPVVKRRPRFVVEAVTLLAGSTSEGKVDLGNLGNYLRRTDPGFSPQNYGHSGLLEMLKTYDLLVPIKEPGGHWSVRLAGSGDHSTAQSTSSSST